MKSQYLNTENMSAFLEHLKTQKDVYAPYRKGSNSVTFEKVEDVEGVVLDYTRTLSSVKKYFLPNRELLLSFNSDDNSFVKPEINPLDAIFFGVHNYDLQALLKLDYNFINGNPEKNYLTRRAGCVFVGVSYKPDNFHFSGSVDIDQKNMSGFDIFLTKCDEGYIVNVFTEVGEKLISGFDKISTCSCDLPASEEFNLSLYAQQSKLSEVLEESYDNPIWDEMAEKCVACGQCNLSCPTCYCFNVEESIDLSLSNGTRDRHLDSCMLRDFTAVAGGEIFREKLAGRIRHRIYRKFKYISDVTGKSSCVGCGRCTAYCPAGISITDIVNRLVSDYDKKKTIPCCGLQG